MSKELIIKTERTTNYVYLNSKNSTVPTIFLHGFTGSHHSWDKIIKKLDSKTITLDLPGHRKSIFNNLDSNYNINNWCEDFNEILKSLKVDKVNLCGYSMGGRLAIVFGAIYPDKINTLILESTSCGINSKKERQKRLDEDLDLCTLIELDIVKFIQKWENNDLFLNQRERNPQEFLKQKKERLLHNPNQLSKALKSFSQGKMEYYIDTISKFKFPITIINGAEDIKYVGVGQHMQQANPNYIKQIVIPQAGHNMHLEYPSQFAKLITNG